MTAALRAIAGLLIPAAHASWIEQLGTGPGIDAMWAAIKSLFPHPDFGQAGLAFVFFRVTTFLLEIIGGCAVAVIIYGGIRMIVSQGDESGTGEAKKIIQYAALGVALALIADVAVLFVENLLKTIFGA